MAPRIIYNAGFICECVAAACIFISYVTPYWLVSWPRLYSGFKKIGLWEACFAGNVIPNDPTQRAYHGCWWILAPEYWDIRSWLMPPWFVVVQVFMTFAFVIHLVLFTLSLLYFIKCFKTRIEGCILSTCSALQVASILLNSVSVILFGVRSLTDYNWMPKPEINYLSWSYGMATLAVFFSVFSLIALICYTRIVRREMKAPPKRPNVMPMIPLPKV